ncbi:hypothetical protein [Butyrivibrio sp. AD3002]|uniref:hypothetical protein n=1 Tax=Butyrivibrio sp. AD3002 TaxID=1280670 RepID=UPI0003FF522B|nr:hypothetical protein [Butyrivibrio sp. AD3002]
MRSKPLSLLLMSTIVCCLFSGCGKKGNDAATAPENNGTTEAAQNSTSDSAGDKSAEKSESASPYDGVPPLVLHKTSKYEWNEDNKPYLKHYYSYLSLGKEYAASHSELAKNINDARDDIEAHEYDYYTLSMEEAKEYDDLTFECSWYTYLRRADSKYISFVNECENAGTFDFNVLSYIAHSYYVDSGKEIKLTDIVADEDAFYDLLAEKVKKNVDETLTDYMGEPSNLDKEGIKKSIKTCMQGTGCAWTLDPQGVTFWFDSNVFSPFSTSNTVFFSEDKDGKIFKEEFAKDIPDEWIMMMPGGDNTHFDEDDDGEENTVLSSEITEYDPDFDDYYVSGFMISYEDDYKKYKGEEASSYFIFLMHKDHKNLILESHYEYDYALISAYPLVNGKIKQGDTMLAGLEYAWDEADEDEDAAPFYMPVGTEDIRVLIDEGGEEHDVKADTISVSMDGELYKKGEENAFDGPKSEEDLFTFMEGEWSLVNPVTLKDYGHMEIKNDGSFTYGYTGSDETCTGEFTPDHQCPGEKNVPLSFSVNVSGIDKMTFADNGYYVPDDGKDTSNVKLYYGSCDKEDFIYMEETGNGDSFMGSVLFQDQSSVDGSFSLSSNSYLMHRKSSETIEASANTGSFYAWVWKADDKGLWAQEMKPLTWDGENEYTLNRFTAAAFEPKQMSAEYYKYSDGIDKKLLLNGQRLEMEYPRYMCKLSIGSDGSIKDIEEVDSAFYGMYDLGDLDPEISYDGLKFNYNGTTFDLEGKGAGNAILDVYHAYGKEIVECHVNPHTSLYYIFDKFRGEFCEELIDGTNLIWLDDDFTTAIYAQKNEVRDLCGDFMFAVDGEEISDLEFTDGGKRVKCSYYVNGYSDVEEETFEMPERRDAAMNAYCNYVDSGRAGDYRKFMEYAPEDAVFLAVTDPQAWARDLFFLSDMLEETAVNYVMVVSLHDNSVVDVYKDGETCTATEYLDKGKSSMYKMTVSETMPLYTIKVTTDEDGKETTTEWAVTEFSGETYQHCSFITGR